MIGVRFFKSNKKKNILETSIKRCISNGRMFVNHIRIHTDSKYCTIQLYALKESVPITIVRLKYTKDRILFLGDMIEKFMGNSVISI